MQVGNSGTGEVVFHLAEVADGEVSGLAHHEQRNAALLPELSDMGSKIHFGIPPSFNNKIDVFVKKVNGFSRT